MGVYLFIFLYSIYILVRIQYISSIISLITMFYYQDKRPLRVRNPDSTECLPPLRNPDILIGENDLTSLSYLNEPEGKGIFY